MRIHTALSAGNVQRCLNDAKDAGKITSDVNLTVFSEHRSHTSAHAFEIQLGTYDRDSLPAGTVDQHGHKLTRRKYKNSGNAGAAIGSEWAATWHEYGWFLALIFEADANAHTEWYSNRADFDSKTKFQFDTDEIGLT